MLQHFAKILMLSASVHLEPSHSFFVRAPFVVQPSPRIKLPKAERLGITSYHGIAKNASKAASLPNFELSLNFEFGKMDESTFNSLRAAYGGWSATQSSVHWNPNMTYTLLDFLPPVMQAVHGLHFCTTNHTGLNLPTFVTPSSVNNTSDSGTNASSSLRTERLSNPLTNQTALIAFNCWGYAWEVMVSASRPDVKNMCISTADPTVAWNTFTSPAYFDFIQSTLNDTDILVNATLRNEKLDTGDVLLLWHDNGEGQGLYLDHVAIFIDEDLYYEKSGSGNRVPFRLNTWDGLTNNFPPKVFNWNWYRRSNKNDENHPLPYAKEAFGLHKQSEQFPFFEKLRKDVTRMFSMTPGYGNNINENGDPSIEAQAYTGIISLDEFEKDENGRAFLPESAFDKELFCIALPSNIFEQEKALSLGDLWVDFEK